MHATPSCNGQRRAWRLVRNHALAPRQFFAGLAVLSALLALVGVLACAAGLWPVALFCLANGLACAAGFAHAAWHAVDGESVELTDDGLVDIRVTRGLAEDSYQFPASWVRVETGHGTAPVQLACGGVRLSVGQQVTAPQRRRFERELRAALGQPVARAPSGAR